MPEALLQQKLFPWDGAFDSTKHPLLISANDFVDSQNLIYTTYSTKKKRPGITQAFTNRLPGNSHILSGVDFWRLGVQFEVVYNGKAIYAIDPRTGIFDDISQDFSVPVDDIVTFVIFQGLLVVCFSSNIAPKAWTGSGQLTDLHSTAPNAAFGRVWLNKLWMPDPTVKGRILHSNTGTVSFTGGDSGSLDLDPNDDDPDGITAIFPPFYRNLYVTKRFSTYQIKPFSLSDGTLIFYPDKISDGIGCISHNAVASAPDTIFFPSDEGIHYFQSTDKLSEVSYKEFSIQIASLWTGETNFKRAQTMSAVYDKNLKSYIVVYPSFSSLHPNDAWGFSLVANKWYRWRNYGQTSIWKYVDSTSKKVKTLVGSFAGDIGFIDQDVTTDYGFPFNIAIQTGIIAPTGSPDDSFSFQFIAPIFVPQVSGDFYITYKVDGSVIETQKFNMQADGGDLLGENFIVGQSLLGSVPQVKIDKRNVSGYGMLYELYIEHEGVGDNNDFFEMLGILIDVDRVEKSIGRTVA